MRRLICGCMGIGLVAGALMLCATAGAQQKAQAAPLRDLAYDLGRETVVQGTVVQYVANSSVSPLGPHVTVQTSSGIVDVHLGSAQLLEASHFTLSTGDSLRIVGENVPFGSGTQFLARVVQKGNQVLAVRSTRGFPLAPTQKFGARSDGGAL